MLSDIRLYFRYVGASIRSQMQYRASFLMQALGLFMALASEFVGIWALFDRFGAVKGWSLPEIALFFGMANISFALSEMAVRGFDTFDSIIKSGEFDRYLVRPRSTALQVASREFQLLRFGRLTQGLMVLIYGSTASDVTWTLPTVGLLLGAILGGASLFSGLFVLQATLAFWTTETLELANTVTYGGVETAQYPLTIYRPWFRRFFTVVVPLACVTYFPATIILGRPDELGTSELFRWLAPLVGVTFFAASLQVWKFGVRHYRSTGS